MSGDALHLARTPAPDAEHPGPGGRRHRWADLYHEHTNYQFIDRSWRWLVISGTLLVVSFLALAINGLNLGIDFTGGTQWTVTVQGRDANVADVRDVLAGVGQGDAKVIILGNRGVRVQTEELRAADRVGITDALAKYANADTAGVSVTNVGPTWGDRVSKKALQALVVFFIAIAIYLSLRMEWRMALAAILAVIHDIIITVGVYAVIGWEVTPATLVAFLTILGFSLYDTVVVFDKVKENEAHLGSVKGDTYSKMVNRSLNQVLMRSLNTSFVAVLPVLSLLVVGSFMLGAVGLQDFALALLVGLLTGVYSSIFVATPIVAWLKEREPKYRAVRERALTQLARDASTPAPAPRPTRSTGGTAVAVADPIADPIDDESVEAPRDDAVEDRPVERPAETPRIEPKPSTGVTKSGGVTPRPRQQRSSKKKRR